MAERPRRTRPVAVVERERDEGLVSLQSLFRYRTARGKECERPGGLSPGRSAFMHRWPVIVLCFCLCRAGLFRRCAAVATGLGKLLSRVRAGDGNGAGAGTEA